MNTAGIITTYWIRNEASRKEKGATDVDDL